MPSDHEMEGSDSSTELTAAGPAIAIDPAITALVVHGPAQLTLKGVVYLHHQGIRNTRAPSPVWQLGDGYKCQGRKAKFWRCGLCKHNEMLNLTGGTTSALRHLATTHRVDRNGQLMAKGRRGQPTIQQSLYAVAGTVASTVATTVSQLVIRFDVQIFRTLLIRWIVTAHVAFSCVESDALHALLLYICPSLEAYLVRSGNTIRRWIGWEFKRQREHLKIELAAARSRIHISFDLWTSPNSMGLAGVVFHFVDKDVKVRNLLAGLRRVEGCHTGENIAEAMIPVITDLISSDQIGYFIGDNATSNDTTIRLTLARLRPDLDPDSRRVRCIGHIINLVAKAFLFGNDADAFEEESQCKKELTRLEEARELWRKKGPLGKLHNTVLFIRKTPQRREAFHKLLTEEDRLAGLKDLMVIADNETRWNSTYLSIQRALKLRVRIELFSMHHRDDLGDDFIYSEDWSVLERLAEYLEPFHHVTKLLEGNSVTGHFGAVWQTLPAIEFLLRHLERLKEAIGHDPRITECINNSWAKLNSYYLKTDANHALYAAATLLHPVMRMGHFHKSWTGKLAKYIPKMERRCREVWQAEYLPQLSIQATETTQATQVTKQPPDEFLRSMLNLEVSEKQEDEFTRYNRERSPVENAYTFNPVKWWSDNRSTYPTLYLWALDSLAIPAMSAECERVFSSTKKLITPERNRLSADIIEASECLKNWWDGGLILQHKDGQEMYADNEE